MRNTYYYHIYQLVVQSNVPMPLLPECSTTPNVDITIEVCYIPYLADNAIRVTESRGLYTVELGPYAVYTIDPINGRFECSAIHFEAFFSTLFNIPFSVYFALQGERLLHTCTMFYDQRLICFVGEKGSGKSTLTRMLDGTVFRLYSDDTLRLTESMIGYRAHHLIKFTDQTTTALRLQTTNVKNAVGKQYAYIASPPVAASVGALIAIKRTSAQPSVKKLSAPLARKTLFCGNIVGAQYFPALLLKALFSESVPPFPCYMLCIPDGLTRLVTEKGLISSLICKALAEDLLYQTP